MINLSPAPLLCLLALPVLAYTLPLTAYSLSLGLIYLLCAIHLRKGQAATVISIFLGVGLMALPPAYVPGLVYVRAAERLAPVAVMTRTECYHLVVALCVAGFATYSAIPLAGRPHVALLVAALAMYFALFLGQTYNASLAPKTMPLLQHAPGVPGSGLWNALRKHGGWCLRIVVSCCGLRLSGSEAAKVVNE